MKKNPAKIIYAVFGSCIIAAAANCYILLKNVRHVWLFCLLAAAFLFLNICPALYTRRLKEKRLKVCQNGCELLRQFLASTVLSVVFWLFGIIGKRSCFSVMQHWPDWLFGILIVVLIEAVVFWNGIIRVYITSAQLGIKWRVIGILCGWIPIAHLIALHKIIQTASCEVQTENDKLILDESRTDERICATKYPLLLVHGVFFRDFRYLNYWGRVPKELEKNGAVVFYGNHQSAASVQESGKELAERIKEIVCTTGCEKVNIIAHSKGGLDCRFALSNLGAAPFVASLTTVNTPHRGCEFADYLLSKIGEAQKNAVAKAYNATLRRLGDCSPDFLAAVGDLTAEACRKLNEMTPDIPEVFYQSIGSCLNVASGGRFPLNMTHYLVRHFDGENDGLVGQKSFAWGKEYRYLEVKGKRGISHGDMIDLNRENLPEFDVREFYVQLVSDLKKRGL